MRMICLSSFRTNTFESEVDLELTDRDLSVASIVRQVARSAEPDLDAPSTQPPKPARSSKKLISPPLILGDEDSSGNGVGMENLGEVNLEVKDLFLSSDEGTHIASAFEQNSILSELHRGRMNRFLKYSKNESRVPQRFTSWKKKAHRKEALQGEGVHRFEVCNSMKRSLSTTTPRKSRMQLGFPLTTSSKKDIGLDGFRVNSVTTFNRPFTLEEEKESAHQNQECVSKKKKRSMIFTTKWNPLMCSAPSSKRSRTLKEKKTCSENENKETTTTLPNRFKTTFKFWRPTAST